MLTLASWWFMTVVGTVMMVAAVTLFVAGVSSRSARWFAGVLGFYGAGIAAGYLLGTLPHPRLDPAYLGVAYRMAILTPFAGVAFLMTFPKQRGPWWLPAAIFMIGVGLAAGQFLNEAMFQEGWFGMALSLRDLVFAIGALLMVPAMLGSMDGARRASLVLVGLGYYVTAACACIFARFTTRLLVGDLFPNISNPPGNKFYGFMNDAMLLAAFLLTLAALAWVLVRARAQSGSRPVAKAYVVAFAALAAAGAFAGYANAFWGETGTAIFTFTYGAAQVIGLGIVVYGILRLHLFDLDLKAKLTIRHGTVPTIFVATFFVLTEATASIFADWSGSPIVGIVGTGMLLVAISPLRRAANRWAERLFPGASTSDDYLTFRRMEVYRAAVEQAAADDGISSRERAVLSDLRSKLGIREPDAVAIERHVLQGVPPLAAPGELGSPVP